MAKIFDTHAHYDDEKFDADREELLNRLVQEEGVGCIVNAAASLKSTESALALAKRYPFIYATAGVHPDDTKELTAENFQWLTDLAKSEEKIVAIGEIGLDYYWDSSPRETQKYWFDEQMGMAQEIGLPVVIHSREAAKDTLDMVKAAGGKDMKMDMHCFSYTPEIAREYLDMGHYLGIGGVVTFKNGRKLKDVVEYMPLDRILLETDAPYLTPEPYRGKRNHSGLIAYVVDEIARIKQVSREEVLEVTWNNAIEFYGVNLPADTI
jgi:TatD DNase family protein